MTRTLLKSRLLPAALAAAGLLLAPRFMRVSQAQDGMPHGDLKLDCGECHNAERWVPVEPKKFEHAVTGFVLEGAHFGTQCRSCHASLVFNRVGTACADCHKDAHRGELGFRCETCHTSRTWTNQREMFAVHNRTRFPLLAAHRSVDCARCHAGGRYAGTPSDCYACHRSDYDRTNNPNHASAGFPTRCQDCHSTNAWRPASFDHDGRYFPIYSGKHRGAWGSCGDCHVNTGNYRGFECINCHAHNRSEMDGKHRDVRGYQYVSRSCYQCHPRGVAEDD
jgi:hypothetical protein